MTAGLVRQWIDRAAEDLTVARLVFKQGHPSHACFLAQQCIEKSLKAFLLARKSSYPRAHKLVDLLAESIRLDSAYAEFQDTCLVIDQYYVPTRYPNGIPGGLPSGLPGGQEAEEAIDSAQKILDFTLSRI